jgi:hypothetical protein
LALVPAGARSQAALRRRILVPSVAVAAAMVAFANAWVLWPSAVRLAPPSYNPRLDLSNELYGWPQVMRAVRAELDASTAPEALRTDRAVVAPHWVLCAQLEAALKGDVPVGCNSPLPDDFDGWWPRHRWRTASTILWVTDGRFGPPPALGSHATLRSREVRVERAGRVVRTFSITVFSRSAVASSDGCER